MSLTHLHLMLTHVPVLGVLFGFLIMVYAIFRKKEEVKKVAFLIFVVSALITIPTYFTGGKSEESVEDLPGVSESIIEKHEDTAQAAAYLTYLLGIIAIFGLLSKGTPQRKNMLMYTVLTLSLITSGVMAQTANLGGQIRHSEIRNGGDVSVDKENDEKDSENEEKI